ncbi:MAG: 2,3-bisphosphoglycerate-independent phosphoglycerate mutase, partial [Rhodospirillales bacterium]|nr:2,3-bisphosphoglycerate-independent phosphoglycerate mutase [Rhodospirillales bacterium]
FDGFERPKAITFETALGMVEYSAEHSKLMGVLFPSVELTGILGQVLSDAGLKQLRIAETEKYAHVTFFFNGGEEKVFPGEDRILVPSPKIATYDLQPSMSAPEVTDKLVAAIGSGKYDVIIVNYANGDMVGHTGFIDAAVKAAETVDTAIGRLDEAVKLAGGVMLITADHGNLEQMSDPESGQQHTAHTLNPVPLVMVNGPSWAGGLNDGRLADIAPTILRLMGMKQPSEMTGRSLIDEGTRRDSA